ncbi:MAG: hypothetical protein ABI760_26275, partial [Ferruginibacter sp.]
GWQRDCPNSRRPPAVVDVKYMSLTSGSTWNYELIDILPAITTPFSINSTSNDSTINGKSYHVYSNNSGSGNEYYNITGNEYYNFRKLPLALGGSSVENIYLKDNVAAGDSWSQSYPIMVSGIALNAALTNTITEKGISKTVKGVTYNNVIHVITTIAVSFSGVPLPASALVTDIQSFYAPKFGMIQSINKINFNYSGISSNTNQQTNLNTADIK